MKSLRTGEKCPLHNSYACSCHGDRREGPKPKKYEYVHGVAKIEDPFHPRGFREKCTPAILRKRKHMLLASNPVCMYCGKNFLEDGTDYREIHLAHKEPKGHGGARHDDHIDNLGLAHAAENLANGSRRIA